MFAEKFENKETPYEKLSAMMKQLAQKVNEDVGEAVVDQEGALDMRSFLNGNNGYLTKEQIKKDESDINLRLDEWRGIYSREEFVERRKKEKNAMLEMVITGVLSKFLKDNFIVTRASTYDDYMNGVDNLIIDKETGNVVCAFDEVNDQPDKKYSEQKKEKILKKAKAGGTTIKYGLAIENDKFVKREIDNIPIFYLALTNDQLNESLNKVSYDLDSHINEQEINIFKQLVELLEEEYNMMNEQSLPPAVSLNLDKFAESLQRIKSII